LIPESNTAAPLLAVDGLRVYFDTDDAVAKAVDDVSFHVNPTETVCIVGESGCGKTVTALATLGLLPRPPARIAGGIIRFAGQDLLTADDAAMMTIRGKRIGMIFQEPMSSLNPVFTIGDQIHEAITVHARNSNIEARKRTLTLLKDVGIPDPDRRYRDYPHQLSGGQRQRVMIAMALACDPDLIIADEPTTALDVTVQAQILQLLRSLQQGRRLAVQYITHDLSVVAAIADRVYVMYAGQVVEEGPTAAIFQHPRHPYTEALMAALPTASRRGQRLYNIPGTVPHPAHKPTGCAFHPRCTHRRSTCRTDPPDLCDWGHGHRARCPILHAAHGSHAGGAS